MTYSAMQIAQVCHEANRGLQAIFANPEIPVSPPWENLDGHTKASAVDGVLAILNGKVASPADSHRNWMGFKVGAGWRWGPVKDLAKREHPLLVDYDDLPPDEKVKDELFFAVVKILAGM